MTALLRSAADDRTGKPAIGSLRLLLIVPGFSADRSDDCIPALRDLVRELSRRHSVEILTLRYPVPARVYELDGARVTALGGANGLGWRRAALLLRATRWLRRAVKRGAVDLVHALWADEPGFLAVELARRTGVPAVVSLMGGELARLPEIGYGHQLHRAPRWLVGHSLRSARHLTVGSPWLLDRATERLSRERVTALRPRVTPLGVDPALFRGDGLPGESHPLTDGNPKILTVGSLTPVKGHADLISAFAIASRSLPRAVLYLLGDGPLRADLARQADAAGMGDRLRFLGALPHNRLPACYRAADFCALGSHWESQSMVALEAAACGKVTVGSRVGILTELAVPQGLAAPGDVDGLARALELAAGAAREWGAEAMDRAVPFGGMDAAIARFESVYAAALREREGGSAAAP